MVFKIHALSFMSNAFTAGQKDSSFYMKLEQFLTNVLLLLKKKKKNVAHHELQATHQGAQLQQSLGLLASISHNSLMVYLLNTGMYDRI